MAKHIGGTPNPGSLWREAYAGFEKPVESRAAGKTRLKRLDVLVDLGRLFSD